MAAACEAMTASTAGEDAYERAFQAALRRAQARAREANLKRAGGPRST
jgi:hypothetical protein